MFRTLKLQAVNWPFHFFCVLGLTLENKTLILSMFQNCCKEWYYKEWCKPGWYLDFVVLADDQEVKYCLLVVQLRKAKAEVITAGRIAKRFLFSSCTTSTSAVTPDPWLQNLVTSRRNTSRRIGFSRNPSQRLSRNQSVSRRESETAGKIIIKQQRDVRRWVPAWNCQVMFSLPLVVQSRSIVIATVLCSPLVLFCPVLL